MAFYWFFQFVGGLIGALMYQSWQNSSTVQAGPLYYHLAKRTGCTIPSNYDLNPLNVFGLEFIATFMLVFTVFGTAVDPKSGAGNYAPIAIGFSLFTAAYGECCVVHNLA